jgi:hypothetical protein
MILSTLNDILALGYRLGRYGDRLDPDGDLATMAAIRRNMAPGGTLVLGTPVGIDGIEWNCHRRYGQHRWPLLLEGFDEREWILDGYKVLRETYLAGPKATTCGYRPQPVVVATLL